MTIFSKLAAVADPVQALSDKLSALESDAASAHAALDRAKAHVAALAPSILDGTGDANAYAKAKSAIDAAQDRLDLLAAARTGLERQLHDAELARTRDARLAIRKTFERLGRKRAEHAAGASAAIEQLLTHWTGLHDLATKIATAYPGAVPSAAVPTRGEILRAIETELCRISNAPGRAAKVPPLPGAKNPSLMMLGTPERLPTLASAIEEGNAHLLRSLEAAPSRSVEAVATQPPEAEELFTAIPAEPAPIAGQKITAAQAQAMQPRPARERLR